MGWGGEGWGLLQIKGTVLGRSEELGSSEAFEDGECGQNIEKGGKMRDEGKGGQGSKGSFSFHFLSLNPGRRFFYPFDHF